MKTLEEIKEWANDPLVCIHGTAKEVIDTLTALCDGYRGDVAELKAKMESGLMHNCNICGTQMSVSIAKDGSGSSVSYAPESINAASRALAANAVFGDATPKIAATIRARATKGDSDEG